MSGATGAGFFGNNAAAAEFDIVWMRAEGDERARGLADREVSPAVFMGRFRCRLHRVDQWFLDLQR